MGRKRLDDETLEGVQARERERAESLSRCLLEPLGQRWLHVQGVARRAGELGGGFAADELDQLLAAAWLHDIGYAPALVRTGMHALDGAAFVRAEGFDGTVVSLVGHHTGARWEAEERDLTSELAAFDPPPAHLHRTLATADLTVGPNGQLTTVDGRIHEILQRYDEGHPVHRAVTNSAEQLRRLTTAL